MESKILKPGDRLGNYEIVQIAARKLQEGDSPSGLIGQGGMGQVYQSRHTQTGAEYAIKILNQRLQNSSAAIERFKLEASEAAKLSQAHPNILKTFDLDFDNHHQKHFLVMDLIPGFCVGDSLEVRTLQDLVKARGPINEEQAIHYLSQALDGLAHAHSRERVHFDIKPDNLFLRDEDTLLIGDFGLVGSLRSHANVSLNADSVPVIGDPTAPVPLSATPAGYTLDYASPEHIHPEDFEGQINHRSDLYSVGATLYFLFVGRAPRLLPENISQHVSGLRSDWDPWFKQILAENPDHRFPSAGDARKALPSSRDAKFILPLRTRHQRETASFRGAYETDTKLLNETRRRLKPFAEKHANSLDPAGKAVEESFLYWEKSFKALEERPPKHCWHDLAINKLIEEAGSKRDEFAGHHDRLERILRPLESEHATFQDRSSELKSLWAEVRRDAEIQKTKFSKWSPEPLLIRTPVGSIQSDPIELLFDWVNSTALSDVRLAERHMSNLIVQGDALDAEPPTPSDLVTRRELASETQAATQTLQSSLEKLFDVWQNAKRHIGSISSKHQDYLRAKQEQERLLAQFNSLKQLELETSTTLEQRITDPEKLANARLNLSEAERRAVEALETIDQAKREVTGFPCTELRRSGEFGQLIDSLTIALIEAVRANQVFEAVIKAPSSAQLADGLKPPTRPIGPSRWLIPIGSLLILFFAGGLYVHHERLLLSPEARAEYFKGKGDLDSAYEIYEVSLEEHEAKGESKEQLMKDRENAIVKDEKMSRLLTQMAELRFEQGRWYDGLNDARDAVRADENNDLARSLYGFFWWEFKGRGGAQMEAAQKRAINEFKHAEQINPRSAAAVGFGSLLQMQGTANSATIREIHHGLQSPERRPLVDDDYTWVYHLADAYGHFRLQHPKQMKAAAERCENAFRRKALRRRNPLAIRVFEAYLNYFAGDNERAVDLCLDAIHQMEEITKDGLLSSTKPCRAFAHKILGDSYRSLSKSGNSEFDRQNGIRAYERAIEIDPDYVMALNNLANTLSSDESDRRASLIAEGLTQTPNSDYLLIRKAESSDGATNAAFLAEIASENQLPHHPGLLRLRALSAYAADEKLTEEMEALLATAIQSNPSDYLTRNSFWTILVADSRLEEAMTFLRRQRKRIRSYGAPTIMAQYVPTKWEIRKKA